MCGMLNRIIKRCAKAARDEAGFTLVELLVATAVSAVILVMVYSAHSAIMASIRDLTQVAKFYERANLVLTRIDRDLSCTYINKYNKKAFFIGENKRTAPYEGRLSFVTIDYQDVAIASSPNREYRMCDVHEVGYRVVQERDRPGVYSLYRREGPTYDDEPSTQWNESLLISGLTDIRFEFKVKNDWTDTWNSREDKKYPEAVKTTLKMINQKGKEESLSFISYINMAQ